MRNSIWDEFEQILEGPRRSGKYLINISKCTFCQTKKVRELLANYDKVTEQAPEWFERDYYTLLAAFPVTIIWRENGR